MANTGAGTRKGKGKGKTIVKEKKLEKIYKICNATANKYDLSPKKKERYNLKFKRKFAVEGK